MFNYFVLLLVCDLKTTRVLLPAFMGILSNITLRRFLNQGENGALGNHLYFSFNKVWQRN